MNTNELEYNVRCWKIMLETTLVTLNAMHTVRPVDDMAKTAIRDTLKCIIKAMER